jgi:hypothetical protein
LTVNLLVIASQGQINHSPTTSNNQPSNMSRKNKSLNGVYPSTTPSPYSNLSLAKKAANKKASTKKRDLKIKAKAKAESEPTTDKTPEKTESKSTPPTTKKAARKTTAQKKAAQAK